MPDPIYPDVNGVRTSYCSIELGVDGLKLQGITSINYRETAEIPKIYGTSAKPLGRPRGRVDFEGDIEMFRAEWNQLLVKLTRNGTVGFMELAWPITVTYSEALAPDDTVTDRLVGARFHSPDAPNAEGAEATKIKVSLSLMDIRWANKYQSLRARR